MVLGTWRHAIGKGDCSGEEEGDSISKEGGVFLIFPVEIVVVVEIMFIYF